MGKAVEQRSFGVSPSEQRLNQDIERRLEFVDWVQRAMEPLPLVARLKAKGLI